MVWSLSSIWTEFMSLPARADGGKLCKADARTNGGERPDMAALREAIARFPDDCRPYNDLAAVHRAAGDAPAALVCLDRAARINPGLLPIQLNRCAVLLDLGRVDAACDRLSTLAADHPGHGDIALLLGTALQRLGEPEAAAAVYRQALSAQPDRADLQLNLGNLLRRLGDRAGAAVAYEAARWLRSADAAVRLAGAVLLHENGRTGEAEAAYREALALDPELVEAHLDLGNLLVGRGQTEDGVACYRRALALDPAHAGGQLNLGAARQEQAWPEQARRCFRRALRLDPANAAARLRLCFAQLPILYRDMAELEQARVEYERDLRALADHYAAAPVRERAAAAMAVGGWQPFYLAYQGRDDCALQTLYGELVADLMAARHPDFVQALTPRRRRAGRPLRVGFLAGHIGRHSAVNVTLRGWIDDSDPAAVEWFCYHTQPGSDDETARIAKLARGFTRDRPSIGAWAEAILGDGLDALIFADVGMDPMAARLAALRLAPVQAMTTGHPVTTGLPTMDLFLSSDAMEAPEAQDHYRERLVRLPGLGYAYRPLDPPPVAVSRADLGIAAEAPVYWCCQSLFKYLPVHDGLFARIARGVPDAVFLFIAHARAPRVTELFRARLAAAFAAHGLDAERHCRFLAPMDHARFDAVAGLADVFLDNPSWSGHNTALEALPHGLPIVTLPGRLMRQRHALGILSLIGVTQTVTASEAEYVDTAVRLGRDRPWRDEVRDAVRHNGPRAFGDVAAVRGLEQALRAWGSGPPG
jgi:protein O-GlcNAc transferase